jgi:predicted nucleic acid-binding protein
MDVLPWDQDVAKCYGAFGVKLKGKGISLCEFDMMIAANTIAVNSTFIRHEISQTDRSVQLR